MILLRQKIFSVARVVSPNSMTGRKLLEAGKFIGKRSGKVLEKEAMVSVRSTTRGARNITGCPINATQKKGTTVVSYYNGEGFKIKPKSPNQPHSNPGPSPKVPKEVQGKLDLDWETVDPTKKLPKDPKPKKVLSSTTRRLDKTNNRVLGNKFTLNSKGEVAETFIDPELNLGQHKLSSKGNIKIIH